MNRFAILDVEEPVSKRQKALEAKKAEAAPAPTPAPKETPKEAPKKAPQDAPKKAPQDAPKKTQDEKPKAPRGEGKPSDKPREPRQPREPREPREPRDSNDKPREPRQPREPREPREPRDSTDKPRGVREFKERSDRPFRPRPPRDGEAPVAEGSDAPAPAHFEHRRGGSGRGRGRGDGTRREFDRRGPRVEGGEKKHGFGKGNWGAPGEEEKPAGDAPAQEQAAPSEETAAPAEEAKVEEAPSAPEPEEEDKTMTLEEFKKSRATVKAELPPPRKANEGFEDPKWKNTQVFQREDEVYAKGKEIKEAAAPKRKETKQVERIEIAPTPLIEDRADRSSRRGGRGGSRGGRGGSSRSDRPRTAAPPSLDDAKAFPSLKA